MRAGILIRCFWHRTSHISTQSPARRPQKYFNDVFIACNKQRYGKKIVFAPKFKMFHSSILHVVQNCSLYNLYSNQFLEIIQYLCRTKIMLHISLDFQIFVSLKTYMGDYDTGVVSLGASPGWQIWKLLISQQSPMKFLVVILFVK